jgi:hypothetical protein
MVAYIQMVQHVVKDSQGNSKGKMLWKTELDSLLCYEIVAFLADVNNLGFRLALGQDQLQSLCSTIKNELSNVHTLGIAQR